MEEDKREEEESKRIADERAHQQRGRADEEWTKKQTREEEEVGKRRESMQRAQHDPKQWEAANELAEAVLVAMRSNPSMPKEEVQATIVAAMSQNPFRSQFAVPITSKARHLPSAPKRTHGTSWGFTRCLETHKTKKTINNIMAPSPKFRSKFLGRAACPR